MSSVYAEIWRFVLFMGIGVFNTLFDTGIWRIGVWLLEKRPSWIAIMHRRFKINQYALAQIFSTLVAGSASFALNRTIAFADVSTQTDAWQIARFFSVTGVSMILSTLAMQFLTETNWIVAWIRPLPFIGNHWPITAKLITVAVTMITNFVGYRLFVF